MARNMRHAPGHTVLQTMNFNSGSFAGPVINITGNFDAVAPYGVNLSKLTHHTRTKIHTTKKVPRLFNAVAVDSNVSVNARNVGCSLISHSIVTSSVRAMYGNRDLSNILTVNNYSGGVPNTVVTVTQVGVPTVFICNNAVGPNRCRNRSLAIIDTFRTINRCDTNGVNRRQLLNMRHGTYPKTNSYNNVCATGAVSSSFRTVKVDLVCSSAVTTRSRRGTRDARGSTRTLIGTVHGRVLPDRVLAHGTFRGTVSIVVTINNSAGSILRLLTVTGTVNIRLALSSFRAVQQQIPILYSLGPSNHCITASLRQTNNVPRIVGVLLIGNLLRNSTLAVAKRAVRRILTSVPTRPHTSRSIVQPFDGPVCPVNRLNVLGNGLTDRNTITGLAKIGGHRVANPTHIFRSRRRYLGTVLSGGVITNSIIIIHCRNPGNNPNVQRVLTPASTVVKTKLNSSIKLVASKHFSNNACNVIINRITPRTTINNAVTLIRRKSSVAVSTSRGLLRLGMPSRRLTGHQTT